MSAASSAASSPTEGTRLHASCVLVGRRAALLRGPSGSGKSALVIGLLAIAAPDRLVRLVADDAVDLTTCGGRLVARAAPATKGLAEVRGVGLLKVPTERRAVIGLVVDLVPDSHTERLPEEQDGQAELLGVAVPRLVVPAGAAGNVATVIIALAAINCGEKLPVIAQSGGDRSSFRA